MAIDANSLLERVVSLIETDIGHIAKKLKRGKLDHDSASDLTKYSNALLALTDTIEAKDKQEKNKLAKMSTEELARLAKDIIEGKGKP
jgi:hypothetical protein